MLRWLKALLPAPVDHERERQKVKAKAGEGYRAAAEKAFASRNKGGEPN